MRASRTRMSRYASRILARNRNAARNTSGSTASVTSASRQSMTNIATTMKHQREDVAEHRDHAAAEQLVQRLDVAGDARHQPADRIPVVEAQVEPLQLREDLAAQIVHDASGRARWSAWSAAYSSRNATQRWRPRYTAREQREQAQVAVRNRAVERDLGEPGPDHLERGSEQQDDNGERDRQPVRPQVAQQPPHEARVVRFAEDVFFVVVASLTADFPCRSRFFSSRLRSACVRLRFRPAAHRDVDAAHHYEAVDLQDRRIRPARPGLRAADRNRP